MTSGYFLFLKKSPPIKCKYLTARTIFFSTVKEIPNENFPSYLQISVSLEYKYPLLFWKFILSNFALWKIYISICFGNQKKSKEGFLSFFFFLKKGENRLSFAETGRRLALWWWRPQTPSPGTTLRLSAPGCHTLTYVCEHPLSQFLCIHLARRIPE